MRLLLVEDNSFDEHVFTSCLGDRANVVVASNGGEAFDRLFRRGVFSSDRLPDLIVVDLNVPLLTGHELLNTVKSHSATHQIPVIVWSGSANPVDIRNAYDLGASAYLQKLGSVAAMEAALKAFADFWLCDVRYGV